MITVQLSASGSEVSRSRRIFEAASHCDMSDSLLQSYSMNKVRGTLGTDPLCLLYGTMNFLGYVMSFCDVRGCVSCREALWRLASSVEQAGSQAAGGVVFEVSTVFVEASEQLDCRLLV